MSSTAITLGGRRKRSSSSATADDPIDSSLEPPSRRARRDILLTEKNAVEAELEHERSLRALDSKRFVLTTQRLEKQMEFAMQEAKDSKLLMEGLREENERHLNSIKRSMAKTKAELRDVQEDLDEAQAIASRKELDEDPRIEMLEEDIEAKSIENDALRESMSRLQSEMKNVMATNDDNNQSNCNADDDESKILLLSPLSGAAQSEARPELLQELNRLRVVLADAERKNRQYKQIAEDAQWKTNEFLKEKEQVRFANKRIEQLESKVSESTRTEEFLSEQLRDWQELGVAMSYVLGPREKNTPPFKSDSSNPPEISVLKKYINDAKKNLTVSESNHSVLKKQLEKSKEIIQSLESESFKFERKESVWKKEKNEWEQHKDKFMREIKLLKGQEVNLTRESDNLRSIINTFDSLPLTEAQGKKDDSAGASSAKIRVLEVSLTTAQQQLNVLKEENCCLKVDYNSSGDKKIELQKKYDVLMEKYGKLRDALYAERDKAEKATERANEAEILAGKGSFNPEQTRVLHMGTNPLTVALKEEIIVLKRQIEVLSNGNKKYKSFSSDVDPNKLHQRLKQSFKEQISIFREGVFLITGLKIDMLPDNDRYNFKVRSVFAEREKDHLVFQWPKGRNHVQSLDLLDTEYAKQLTKTQSYEYMQKFHSLPAFMASVQLKLFENSTFNF